MPIYDYKCKSCGNEVEIIHKASDNTVRTCNACGAEMERTIGAVAVIFKGSGFYKTDYKGASPAPSKSGAPTTPSSASGHSENKTSSAGESTTPSEKAENSNKGSTPSSSKVA